MLQAYNVLVGYGGLVFNQMPALQQTIPGHFLGESLEEALQRVQKLLADKPDAPSVSEAGEEYRAGAATVYGTPRLDRISRVGAVSS